LIQANGASPPAMRAIYLNPTGQLGGAERSLLALLSSVRRAEPSWPLHVVMAAEGPLGAAVSALGVTSTVLPFPRMLAALGEHGAAVSGGGSVRLAARLGRASLSLAPYLWQLRRTIRRFAPDLIQTNGLKMHVLGAWSSGPTPLVWHLHDYLGSRPLTARLLRMHVSRCAILIANSHSVADDARAALGGKVKIVPVHNAVDLDRFNPAGARADLDRLSGMPPVAAGTFRIGLLGTFARWKGHETFLRAIAALPRHLPIRAYIIGDSLYQTEGSQHAAGDLRRLASSLDLTGHVGFTGFIGKPETALRALDVVVHASTAPEPFGLVIAEAMACGRAIIVSRAGGAAEIVTPDVDALTHTPGDVRELTERIARLIADPQLRARLATAGRATAERKFDQSRLAREIVPLYRDVTRAAGGGMTQAEPASGVDNI
jgi:glycosyltransferase involved in cell wall biosynthesis